MGLDGESGGVTIIACSNSNVVQLCLDSSMIVHICSYSIAKTSWRVLFDGVGMKKTAIPDHSDPGLKTDDRLRLLV